MTRESSHKVESIRFLARVPPLLLGTLCTIRYSTTLTRLFLPQGFDRFRMDETLCDVVLVPGDSDETFRVHRVLMALSSDYFKAMFTGQCGCSATQGPRALFHAATQNDVFLLPPAQIFAFNFVLRPKAALPRLYLADWAQTVSEAAQDHPFIFSSPSACFPSPGGMREQEMSEIKLHGVTKLGLKNIVDFIYTSKVSLDMGNLQDTLEAANFLQVMPVLRFCNRLLISEVRLR